MGLLFKVCPFFIFLSVFISVSSQAEVNTIEAKLDFKRQEFTFKLDPQARGSLFIEGVFSSDNTFRVHLKFDHLLLESSDVLGDIKIEGRVFKDSSGKVRSITGQARAYNFLINYLPIKKTSFSFVIVDSRLKISSGAVGSELNISGMVGLTQGYPIDLAFKLKGMDLAELSGLLGLEKGLLSGKANGWLMLRGSLSSPEMEANIVAYNGNLGGLEYSHAELFLTGTGSVIQFVDSRFCAPGGGYYYLTGEIDLSAVNKPESFSQIEVALGGDTFSWEDWRISRDLSSYGLSLKKDVGRDFRVGLKANFDDGITSTREDGEKVELEYKLRGPQSLKMYMRQHDELLSLEHRLEF
jgi:hypothetical protein